MSLDRAFEASDERRFGSGGGWARVLVIPLAGCRASASCSLHVCIDDQSFESHEEAKGWQELPGLFAISPHEAAR